MMQIMVVRHLVLRLGKSSLNCRYRRYVTDKWVHITSWKAQGCVGYRTPPYVSSEMM